jgi:hypothetical protein
MYAGDGCDRNVDVGNYNNYDDYDDYGGDIIITSFGV